MTLKLNSAHAIHSGTVDASIWNTPIWDQYKHFALSDAADRNFIHNLSHIQILGLSLYELGS